MKKETEIVHTSVLIPAKLYDEFKKRKIKLSPFVIEQMELEVFRESPEFLKKKIDELEGKHDRERDIILAQLKVAEEKQRWKKERMDVSMPEVMDYRTTIPSKRKGDK